MCTLQRIVFLGMAIVFLIGTIVNFKSALRYICPILILVLSSLGFLIAARQFWLQYFAPPQLTSCTASLERLIQAYPILDALKVALHGSPDCAKVDFTVFTISIAGWSVFMFGTFILLTTYVIYLQKKRRI
jgi:disulfide bond formation protein DsbB